MYSSREGSQEDAGGTQITLHNSFYFYITPGVSYNRHKQNHLQVSGSFLLSTKNCKPTFFLSFHTSILSLSQPQAPPISLELTVTPDFNMTQISCHRPRVTQKDICSWVRRWGLGCCPHSQMRSGPGTSDMKGTRAPFSIGKFISTVCTQVKE